MADLLSVTAPLLIRRADGLRHIMIERFAAAEGDGLVYFEIFWHLQRPASAAIHRVDGIITGDGPWKIGPHVVTVLGCHGTDPELAGAYAEWQAYLQQGAPGYPDRAAILRLASAQGARIEGRVS